MKKTLITVAALMIAGAALAQTTTSANVVGYSKLNVVGGQLTMAALNWDGDTTVSAVFGDQLTGGSVITLWDKDTSGYTSSTKGRAGWAPDLALSGGDAVWINAAASAEIVLSGDVKMDATNSVVIPAGLEMTGLFFPVDIALADTDLADQAPGGSVINLWNGSGYTAITKGRAGWDSNPTIGANQAFWITAPSLFNWDEGRPFNP